MGTSDATPTGQVFISYRRQDGAWPATSLYDRIAGRLGADKVFKDVDSIELGEDFVAEITEAVAVCDVLIAVIGPKWSTLKGPDRKRRLDDPTDFVRLEIKAALERNVRLIPVLVDGATMPTREQLPDDIAGLGQRQALTLDPARFAADSEKLLGALERALGERTPPRRPASPDTPAGDDSKTKRGTRFRPPSGKVALISAAGVAAVVVAIFAAVLIGGTSPAESAPAGTWRLKETLRNVGGAYQEWTVYKNGAGSSYPATQADLSADCDDSECKIKVTIPSWNLTFGMKWDGERLTVQLAESRPVEGACTYADGKEVPGSHYRSVFEDTVGPATTKLTDGVVTSIEFTWDETATQSVVGNCKGVQAASAVWHILMTKVD